VVANGERLRTLVRDAVAAVEEAPMEYRPALAAVVLTSWLRDAAETEVGVPRIKELPAASLGLNEAIAQLGQRSQPEQLVAITAHRLRADAMDRLTRDDFLDAYREMRVPPPQNLSEQIGRCVRRGWLARAADRESAHAWRVTQTGLTEYQRWTRGE
jgi:hypothetical protein